MLALYAARFKRGGVKAALPTVSDEIVASLTASGTKRGLVVAFGEYLRSMRRAIVLSDASRTVVRGPSGDSRAPGLGRLHA